jgi:hypothetical protein
MREVAELDSPSDDGIPDSTARTRACLEGQSKEEEEEQVRPEI